MSENTTIWLSGRLFLDRPGGGFVLDRGPSVSYPVPNSP